MKTRTYQELYNYMFGNHADIDQALANTPQEYKEKQHALKIKKISDFFFAEENHLISPRTSGYFRIILRQIKAEKLELVLFKNTTDVYDKEIDIFFQDTARINTGFQQNNLTQHFFGENPAPELLKQYQAYYYICHFIREMIEGEGVEDEEDAITLDLERAYKMLVIFGNTKNATTESKTEVPSINYFKNLDRFITAHGLFEKSHPLHDMFLWQLPKNDSQTIHLDAWRQIIMTSGCRAIRLFTKAVEIEAQLAGKPPKDYQEAFETGKKIVYKNMAIDPAFADLCMHYDVSETIFERCLILMKSAKQSDKLPNIVINGEDKDIDHPGYYFAKLPAKDPRAYILGHITDCCQSIGGHSEACVIDGVTRQHNGFYVLLKKKSEKLLAKAKTLESKTELTTQLDSTYPFDYSKFDIIGQGYAWLSYNGNLTFDSWENIRASDNPIAIKMLEKFAQKITATKDSTILRVTIGKGGKTPEEFKTEADFPELMREGEQYGDSKEQKLVYCDSQMQIKLFPEYFSQFHKVFSIKTDLNISAETNFSEIKNSPICCSPSNIHSYQQIERIKALSKNPELIPCLQKVDAEAYQSADSNYWFSYYYLLEILAILNHANICTPDNIKITLDSTILHIKKYFKSFHPSDSEIQKDLQTLLQSIIALDKAGILTDDNYKIIAHSTERYSVGRCTKDLIDLHNNDFSRLYNHSFDAALKVNNLLFLARLIDSKAIAINPSPIDGDDSPLKKAIKGAKAEAIKLFIEKKADINTAISGETALFYAVSNAIDASNPDVIKVLIEHRADIHAKNKAGETPFHHLFSVPIIHSKYEKVEVDRIGKYMKVLIEVKSNVNTVNLANETPLISAIKTLRNAHAECPLSILLKQENLQINKEQLLMPETFNTIIEDTKKAEDYTKEKGKEPLTLDERKENSKAVAKSIILLTEAKLIGSSKFDEFIKNSIDNSVDAYAAIKTLSEANILTEENLTIVCEGNYSPKRAVSQAKIAEVLVSLHKNSDKPDLDYTEILFKLIECKFNSESLLQKLYQTKKININATNSKNCSLFVKALQKVLYEKGDSSFGRDEPDERYKPCKNIIKYLLAEKVNVLGQDENGNTTLHLAVIYNDPDLIQQILAAKGDINAKCNDQLAPLHLAMSTGNKEMLKCLLDAKANPNLVATDADLSPLVISLGLHEKNVRNYEKTYQVDIIKELLAAKANVHVEIANGVSVLKLVLSDPHKKEYKDLQEIFTAANLCATSETKAEEKQQQGRRRSSLFANKTELDTITTAETPDEDEDETFTYSP